MGAAGRRRGTAGGPGGGRGRPALRGEPAGRRLVPHRHVREAHAAFGAVPLGRDLLPPVFDLWEWPATGRTQITEDATGSLVVDVVPLDLEEIGSPVPSPVAGARLNGSPGEEGRPGERLGTVEVVPALAPGEHHLQAIGTDGHGFTVDVSYRLLVSPTPEAWSVR